MAQFSTEVRAAGQPTPVILRPWDFSFLRHGFMTREGGLSGGLYASFNLAQWVGDEPSAVRANWNMWHALYPGMRVARLTQVHGNQVHSVDDDCNQTRAGDGMVTSAAGIALAVFSADCVPVLMVDPERRVAGALHSGWRGTLAQIALEGVRAMTGLGAVPSAIKVALGPAIGLCCFEVDAELGARFIAEIPGARAHSRPGRPGKMYLDLRGIITSQLIAAGVPADAITVHGPCTRCANDQFFSRRAAGGASTGLQMSFIGFAPEN
ncbi:MAG TPA: peptidoglycan editing factor PgeF [Candidatus Binataceae bacterium]|nr:peptidoglycan editing factor PgeF [Candidatus Binataceae bacterium]